MKENAKFKIIGIRVDLGLLMNIQAYGRFNYSSNSEFIRAAIREKVQRMALVDYPAQNEENEDIQWT